MDPKELEVLIRKLSSEEGKKAGAEEATRVAEIQLAHFRTQAANQTAPIQVSIQRDMKAGERASLSVQREFAERAAPSLDNTNTNRAEILKRAADHTATSGLELNGRQRAADLIGAVSEKSFLISTGVEVFSEYATELALGKWGGFTVSATSQTGSPSDTSAVTEDVVLKCFYGKSKMQIASQLLLNPKATSTLSEDLYKKLANFVDTQAIAGTTSSTTPDGIKAQTHADHKVAATATATPKEALADLAAGLGLIHAAGIDPSDAIIAVKPALFYRIQAARDVAGQVFPEMSLPEPRLLGHRVYPHSAVANDAMILVPSEVCLGLPVLPGVMLGTENADFSSGTQTMAGMVGYDVKMKHNKAAYFVTGAATAWTFPEPEAE